MKSTLVAFGIFAAFSMMTPTNVYAESCGGKGEKAACNGSSCSSEGHTCTCKKGATHEASKSCTCKMHKEKKS